MTGTATRSRENTRARLLDAAAQVFAEVGLDGAAVEAVCERAGFTRGAFYSNFESKDELFLELCGRTGAERIAAVSARVEELRAAGALDEGCDVVLLVQQVMDTGDDDRLGVMLHSEIRIRALRDPALSAAYLQQERAILDAIARIIQDVVDAGPLALRVPADVAARMLMIVWEGMTVRVAMSGADADQLRHDAGVELGRLVELLLN